MSLAQLMAEAKTAPKAASAPKGGNQKVSSMVYDSKTKQLTMVVSNVDLNYERGTRLDKATNLQVPNSSVKLMQIGKGQFGQNVFGVKLDGTPIRCNMAFRLSFSNEQHSKDSDMIIG